MAHPHRIPARTLYRVWTPFFEALQERHGAFLDELDDRLLDASERAIDSQRAAQNLALSRQIRMASQAILQHFRDRLHETMPLAQPSEPASELATEPQELTLMDTADTEREVALRKVVAGARSVMAQEVDALESLTRDYRLAASAEEAPWHPHALGEAFLQAVEAVPLPPEDCLMLLHWFDRDVVRDLKPQMQDLLEAFRQAGFVVPEVQQGTTGTRGREGAQAPRDPSSAAPEPPGSGSTGSGPGGPSGTAGDWGAFGYQVPVASPVVGASGQAPVANSAAQAVTAVLNSASPATLEPFVMDLLQGLFDLILKREDLNPALREPLSDLQLPLVRIALNETHFFRDRTHPARQMTGLLLNIALRVDPDLPLEEARELPLARLVIENVERVRNEGLNDSAAYARALSRLREDLAVVEEQIAHQAATEQAEAQKEERTLEISYAVEASVEKTVISLGQNIPDQAREQLMDAWVPLMTAQKTAQVTIPAAHGDSGAEAPDKAEGPDRATAKTETEPKQKPEAQANAAEAASKDATDGMQLLHELLELMQKEPDFKGSAPLLARIRAYLEQAPLSSEDRAQIKSDLVSAHLLAAGRKTSGAAPERQPDAPETTPSASSEERMEQARQRAGSRTSAMFGSAPRHADDDPSLMRDHDDEYVEKADNLASGTWVQFTSPAGTKVTRMKLVWRGTHAGRLLFTDAAGRAKRQHSIQGLAHEFRTGRGQIIPEESLFDHLMEQRLGTSA
jgi:hypothetical protein